VSLRIKPLEWVKEQSEYVEDNDYDVFFAIGYDVSYSVSDLTSDLVRVRIISDQGSYPDHYKTVADAMAFANRDHVKRVTEAHEELQQYLEPNERAKQ